MEIFIRILTWATTGVALIMLLFCMFMYFMSIVSPMGEGCYDHKEDSPQDRETTTEDL